MRNSPKMMTTGMVKIDPWIKKVVTSRPEIAQPIPNIMAPIHFLLLSCTQFFSFGISFSSALSSREAIFFTLELLNSFYTYLLIRSRLNTQRTIAVPRNTRTVGSQLELGVMPARKVVREGRPAIPKPKARKSPEKKLPTIFLATTLESLILELSIYAETIIIMTASPMVILAL